MPLYYFNIHEDESSLDKHGFDLPDESAARAVAEEAARTLAREQQNAGVVDPDHRIEVLDDRGWPAFIISYRTALEDGD